MRAMRVQAGAVQMTATVAETVLAVFRQSPPPNFRLNTGVPVPLSSPAAGF